MLPVAMSVVVLQTLADAAGMRKLVEFGFVIDFEVVQAVVTIQTYFVVVVVEMMRQVEFEAEVVVGLVVEV